MAFEGHERRAQWLGIATDKAGEARMPVAEPVINASEHAGEENRSVRIEFTMTPKEITICWRDYGEGSEPDSVEIPSLRARIGSTNKRGEGLHLMKTLSDDCRIELMKHGTNITPEELLR